jgi:serine/threonine protein kinase
MTNFPARDNLVDDLAEEFARRWREGEQPSIEEYANRFPQWAAQIREVFPAVLLMEEFKPLRKDHVPATLPPASPGPMPERLGEYRILREIGRGGMGVVYEALQETLGRPVAIKVLPTHLLDNEKLRARFRRESQAAARLHHTNIVPVFAVGEQDGLCFYVMQLIQGKSVDEILVGESGKAGQPETSPEDHRAAAECSKAGAAAPIRPLSTMTASRVQATGRATPTRNGAAVPPRTPSAPPPFTPRAAANVGIQVADALAYAHAQGVLHRDIKPSNLLFDERGAVWVTDFGVAKLVEEANLTQSGDLVGTLRYMPPERLGGVSDTRGDVYSLGITLYEMLARRPAFPGTTPHHLIQLITQAEPAPLRKLDPTIPRDLETIILKAVARDPAHRYQSAAALSDDLRRFLDDRPVLARRTRKSELVWRWCRRNPALASAIAAAFLLMVAITVVSVAAYTRTAAANRDTAAALAAEKSQREHAENTSTLALEALNRTYERFAPTRLVVTAPTSNEDDVDLPPQPALPPEVAPLLEDLLLTYEQIARAGGEFPRLRAQAAEANYRIGDICQRLGRFEEAAAAFRAAIDLSAQLSPDSAGEAVRIKLARACNELGRTLRMLQQVDEAGQMHERAIQILADAPEAFTLRPECRYELARSYYMLGQRDVLQSPRGLGPDRPPPAGGLAKRPFEPDREPPPFRRGADHGREPHVEHRTQWAVDLLDQLVREFPKVPEYRHLLACCYRNLPPNRPMHGQQPQSPSNDRGVELLRRLVSDFPKVPDYRFDLAEALARPIPPDRANLDEINWQRAEEKTRQRLAEAVDLSAALASQYANVPEYTAAHARYLHLLGIACVRVEKLEEGEKLYRQALEEQSRLVKQHPEVIAYGYLLGLMEHYLGRLLGKCGQLQEATIRLDSAAERVEALRRKNPRLVAFPSFLGSVYKDLAMVLSQSGEPELAAKVHRKADELATSAYRNSFESPTALPPSPRRDAGQK